MWSKTFGVSLLFRVKNKTFNFKNLHYSRSGYIVFLYTKYLPVFSGYERNTSPIDFCHERENVCVASHQEFNRCERMLLLQQTEEPVTSVWPRSDEREAAEGVTVGKAPRKLCHSTPHYTADPLQMLPHVAGIMEPTAVRKRDSNFLLRRGKF